MDRLSGLDASFLYLETPEQLMHVCGLILLDPTTIPGGYSFDRLRDRAIVTKLFAELGPRYQARPGGYTRILKMGFRVGDNAPMALVELVDRPEPTEGAAEAESAGS